MNVKPRMLRALVVLGVSCLAATPAWGQSSWVVWSQPQNSTYAIVPSYASPAVPADIEVADDFEVNGTIERLVVSGYDCFNCAPPDVAGAYVRFYAWTASGPGALQSETFIPDGDAGLLYSADYPAALDITLPTPFVASGRHFVSVQLTFAGQGSWYWWITNNNSPQGVRALTRDRLAGPAAPWTVLNSGFTELNCDVPIMLWGDDGNPPPPGTDPCGEWSVVETLSPAGTDHAILRDVHAIATDDVWAVGEYTALVDGSYETRSMTLHWNGSAWSIVPSPSPSPFPGGTWANFDAVAATAPDDVWAAGGKRVQGPDGFVGTHIFVARYTGESWGVLNTPLTGGGSGSNVQDIEIVGPNDIWFFGDYVNPSGGAGNWPALAMHWNGSSFTVVPTPFPAGGTPGWGLMAGSALGPNDIWAVGGGSDGDYSASGYNIHWDGSSWTRVLGPAPGTYQRLYDVKAIAPDDVWAVGDYFVAGSGYFPLFIHWDGASWTQFASPGGGRSLVAFDSNNIYCGGAGIVHWDGVSWEHVEEFNSVIGPSVTGISAATLCDMWAVGRQIVVGDLLNFSAHLQAGSIGSFTPTADIDGDGHVNINDLLAVINGWGGCPPAPAACPANIATNGGSALQVDINDLLMVINNWGS